jgi:hypothetical protein
LLRILPALDTEVLSVDLFDASLDDQPSFEALSYSWNLDSDRSTLDDGKRAERPILCNGKILHITMNLYNAFIQFREMKTDLPPIWADQICINQEDGQEKVAQLAIMTQIYSTASTVVVWLGKLSPTKNWALDFMESLPNDATSLVKAPTNPPPSPPPSKPNRTNSSYQAIAQISSSILQDARWSATLTILQRQWFTRIWTLQEFLLAKQIRIQLGSREIPSSALIKASTQISHFFTTDPASLYFGWSQTFGAWQSATEHRADLFISRDRHQSDASVRYTAEEYLLRARARDATVPKDKVFAAAAILFRGVPQTLGYASTTRDVFYAFAAERLWPEIGLRALPLVGGCRSHVEGLPSWVPDLSARVRPKALRHCGCPPSLRTGLDAELFRIEGGVLHVRARKVDLVGRVGESLWAWVVWHSLGEEPYNSDPEFQMDTSTTSAQERFGVMFAVLDGFGTTYAPTGERTMTALWKTLLGGATAGSPDGSDVWEQRFYNYFAFTYLLLLSYLTDKRIDLGGSRKPWQVSMIQDISRMEGRVARFLAVYDTRAVDGSSLTEAIRLLSNQIWGADREEDADVMGLLKSPLSALTACGGFYEPATVFGELFKTVYNGRRIFAGERYLGISSEGVKAGDEVFLVQGADVPYILRPSGDDTFTLVGEAYVHGLMGGSSTTAEAAFEDIHIV